MNRASVRLGWQKVADVTWSQLTQYYPIYLQVSETPLVDDFSPLDIWEDEAKDQT